MHRSRFRAIASWVLIVSAARVLAAGGLAAASEDPSAKVKREIRAAQQRVLAKAGTSVSYAVMIDGQVVLADAVGHLDASRKAPATVDTIYHVGSISKLVTAAAIMKLVEEGRVDLDRPVVDYLPTFTMRDPRYRSITVRMLLNHSSGLPGADYTAGTSYRQMDAAFVDKAARYFANSTLKADPGTYSVYCNDGFTLAEFVVSRVSGRPFDQFVGDTLFGPLGMTSAGFANRRLPRATSAGKGNLPPEFMNVMGAGGIATTILDLVRFGDEFVRSAPRALRTSSLEEMARAQGVTSIPGDTTALGYGLGWDSVAARFADVDFGPGVLSKSGGTTQFISHIYVVPRYKMVAAISVTDDYRGDPPATIRDIAARVLRARGIETARPKAVPVPAVARPLPDGFERQFVGSYSTGKVLFIAALNTDRTLTVRRFDGREMVEFESNLVYDGQDFSRKSGEKRFHFVTVGGHAYLLIINEASGTATTLGMRLEPTGKALGGWEARLDRLYLPADVSTDAAVTMPGITLARRDRLDGLVFVAFNDVLAPLAVVDDRRTAIVVPTGRDLNTLTVETVDGEEWLANEAYRLRPVDSLPTLAAGTWKVPAAGTHLLARLPSGPVTVTPPESGRVLTYDVAGTPVCDSEVQPLARTSFPANGYVRLMGTPGSTFTVALGSARSAAAR